MIDRGGCSFVTKVRNAQAANATAVIIADNTCLCRLASTCVSSQPCQSFEPVMDDDGTGEDIIIPSMLLMKQDADAIKTALMQGTMVSVRLSWPSPKSTGGPVVYTLWTTPDDVMSQEFLISFKEAAIALGSHAQFVPRMYITDGTQEGCRKTNLYSDPCPGRCTNYGRYCEPKSYYNADTGVDDGTKMVIESLRRACIWQIYGATNGIGSEWWDYVEGWISKCTASHYSTNCAESIFAGAGVDVKLVDQCMQNSGNFRMDKNNTLLEALIDAKYQEDIYVSPTVLVNGALLRGGLTFGNVLEAICWSLPSGITDPAICSQWKTCASVCPQGKTCVLDQYNKCVQYKPPYTVYDTNVYTDDFVRNFDGYGTVGSSQTTPPPVAPTKPPALAPTVPVASAPTNASAKANPTYPPTVSPTRHPTRNPTRHPTLHPTTHPTLHPTTHTEPPPILSPTSYANVSPATLQQKQDQLKPANDNSGRSETIQIFEGGRGGSNTAFAAGLGSGLGFVVIVGVASIVLLRERRRRRRLIPDFCEEESEMSFVDEHCLALVPAPTSGYAVPNLDLRTADDGSVSSMGQYSTSQRSHSSHPPNHLSQPGHSSQSNYPERSPSRLRPPQRSHSPSGHSERSRTQRNQTSRSHTPRSNTSRAASQQSVRFQSQLPSRLRLGRSVRSVRHRSPSEDREIS